VNIRIASRRAVFSVVFLAAILGGLDSFAADQRPTAPLQPETGPGGKEYKHKAVKEFRYGNEGEGYWIFQPDEPRPESAPVVIFLHGYSAMFPVFYRAWIEHICMRGNIVIYPQYQSGPLSPTWHYFPNVLTAVKDAREKLKNAEIHVAAQWDKCAVVGHSFGGAMTAKYASVAAAEGVPIPLAAMSVQPGAGPKQAPQFGLKLDKLDQIPASTLLVVVVGEDDTVVGNILGREIFRGAVNVPAENKDFCVLMSDTYGDPPLLSTHASPSAIPRDIPGIQTASTFAERKASKFRDRGTNPAGVDAQDYYGIWKIFDALCDCAFYGKNREYALGNTPEQRFMGKWSDGKPVKELVVTDDP